MPNYAHVFRTPEKITHQYLLYYLKEVSPLFRMKGRLVKNVLFDTNKTTEVNILGVLLIYKFFEYSILEKCFSNPKCTLNRSTILQNTLSRYGFKNMVEQFLKDKIPQDYSMNFHQEKNGVFIAPMTLDRGQSKESTEVKCSSKIRDYYSYDNTIVFIILQSLAEIASNFAEHAVSDTKSILVAIGNKNFFEIACADTGDGIISTLGPVLGGKRYSKYKIIEMALKKGVTSKLHSDHMGYGLWLINEFASETEGDLYICSEGGYVFKRGRNTKKGECGFWKGTIVYVRIPLTNKKKIAALITKMKEQYNCI